MIENVPNLEIDDVLEFIGDFPVKPLRNNVIITTNTSIPEISEGADFSDEPEFAMHQYVLAVGSHVKEVVPGNKVLLDLERMMVYFNDTDQMHEGHNQQRGYLKFKPVKVGERYFALIPDSYLDAVVA